MSGINEFWAQVASGGEITDQLEALMTDAGSVPGEAIVALAGSHGFVFDLEDLKASLNPTRDELSDDELEAVSGGTRGGFDHIGNFNFKVEINGVTVAAFKKPGVP